VRAGGQMGTRTRSANPPSARKYDRRVSLARETRNRIARDAIGVGVAVGIYGVSFGVLAVAAGATTAQAVALSVFVFTGASQFAFIGVVAGGGGAAAAMAPALLLATRNAIYGLSLAPIFRGSRLSRALRAHLVIDESTAMARAQTTTEESSFAFSATGLSVFVCWNLGTVVGALAGAGLGDPRRLGLDAMFPAAYLALLSPQLRRPGAPTAAIAGTAIAVALVTLTPPGVPILAAAAALIPAAAALRHTRRARARAA
jgi:4-azaleucine resistance transporter AzlC